MQPRLPPMQAMHTFTLTPCGGAGYTFGWRAASGTEAGERGSFHSALTRTPPLSSMRMADANGSVLGLPQTPLRIHVPRSLTHGITVVALQTPDSQSHVLSYGRHAKTNSVLACPPVITRCQRSPVWVPNKGLDDVKVVRRPVLVVRKQGLSGVCSNPD